MERRTLLAVALTMLVWTGWFWYFNPSKNIQKNYHQTAQDQGQSTGKAVENQVSSAGQNINTSIATVRPDLNKNVKEETVKLVTGKFNFELSNRGASIINANYRDRNIDLVFGNNFKSNGCLDFAVHFSTEEFLNGNGLTGELWNIRKIDDRTLMFFTDVILDGKPLRIEKVYKFTDKGYDFSIEYRFVNTGKQIIAFKNSAAIFSPSEILGPVLDYNNRYNHMEGIYSTDGKYKQNVKGGGFFSKPTDLSRKEGAIDYSGLMSRYFLLIMMPKDFVSREMLFDNRANTGYRTGMLVDMNNLAPGSQIVRSFRVYLGEKDKDMLRGVDPKLVGASDVSTIIEPIRYFVIWSLMWINKLFGNLGWSLVVFSVLTKIVFMPLTKKSTESMKKMQELNPQIKKLQEKYKDKPDVIQREMMKLYKDNKVNPMGGCLPILLQMPFFFALYSALINSIDLWHAPFMLWIKDLSMPDTVLSISGFNVNILPLLMTASTLIQQKQTMVDTGNQQQKIMMYMMPVILLFIFWNMPSGLVLYWFLQNLYQILNQVIVNKVWKKA